MRKEASRLAAALAVVGGLLTIGAVGTAEAAPLTGDIKLPTATDMLVQKTQFYWQDREYCWYPGGWRGPGWYWCGHNYRRGYGWGGPHGWNGWARPGLREYYGAGPRHFRGPGPYGHGPRGHVPGGHAPGGRGPGGHAPGGHGSRH